MKEVSKPEGVQLYIYLSFSLVSRHRKGKNRILEHFCRGIFTGESHLIWKEYSKTTLKKNTYILKCLLQNVYSFSLSTGTVFFHIFEEMLARICV